jgi:hypothetical protein
MVRAVRLRYRRSAMLSPAAIAAASRPTATARSKLLAASRDGATEAIMLGAWLLNRSDGQAKTSIGGSVPQ